MDDPASYSNALPSYLRPLGSVLDRFQSWRVDLNLPHPGKTEDLGAEVRSEFDVPLLPIYRAARLRTARERETNLKLILFLFYHLSLLSRPRPLTALPSPRLCTYNEQILTLHRQLSMVLKRNSPRFYPTLLVFKLRTRSLLDLKVDRWEESVQERIRLILFSLRIA